MRQIVKAALVAVFLCLSTGCAVYGGISLHPEGADAPEFYAPNPIGILGIEREFGRFTSFCEHRSSIPYYESGHGLNECGVKLQFVSY